jgi:two-component system nitrogen regulation response regulator NtrX
LWYRLSAFVLRVPPLRERKDDIGLLAEVLLGRVCREMGLKKRISAEGLTWLEGREYPGNVRELRHIVTRAAVLSDGEVIDREVLEGAPVGMSLGDSRGGKGLEDYLEKDLRTARAQFERDYLREALDRHGGNITATAAAIGMAQSNLSRKLKEIDLK